MAPTKGTTRAAAAAASNAILPLGGVRGGKGLTRRVASHNNIIDPNVENMQTRAKRKADNSPIKNDKIKRSALGNLTNNVKIMTLHPNGDQEEAKKPTAQQLQALLDAKNIDNLNVLAKVPALAPAPALAPVPAPAAVATTNKIMTRAALKLDKEDPVEKCHRVLDRMEEALACQKRRLPVAQKKPAAMPAPVQQKLAAPPPPPAGTAIKPVRRISNDFNKTEESLYMSALEDVSSCESMRLSGNFEAARRRSAKLQTKTESQPQVQSQEALLKASAAANMMTAVKPVPKDVEDFDCKNWDDPFQVSHYAMDIFNYLKLREPEFPIDDYMPRQIHLTTWMRTLLVDWMVEVQETFELNHETLYLAVKIVDLYLCREVINKEKLQLLGAAAFFIACKYDERQPPLIEDFLYICDGAYNHDELVKMEMETLRIINYDLGIPLSYRFLRRYARCAKVQMPTLTLARYILELSLMDYATIGFSDSQMASAALFMALRMHGGVANLDLQTWTSTLIYYTGYELGQFAELVPVLNAGLHRKPRSTIKTIRNKYSHKIFHEVAKVPLLTNAELFQSNLDLNDSNSTCT
ncbi:G2/mitotic-specific cyclin-B3 [Drosophila innubila]|uniref:G2/mitotic-specific cyclin-B3 n=1 Tax=Drosophila innubila TaxID=198719 RepID=UPI00148B71BC|nr:G2/mitotic-specific cyclin-B3 [Drosophila innubila]